jgi:hypothetical protein
MKSFRLKFIDIDESFTISTVSAPIKGAIFVRAPKGTTEPFYFEPQNQKGIESMIGLGTADWPDIVEAIAFNREFGLYIFADPGTSEEYPSYYGGKYLTKYGIYDYWRVDDKDNPSYEIEAVQGTEGIVYSQADNTTLAVEENSIVINNVNASLKEKVSTIIVKDWCSDNKKEVKFNYDAGDKKFYAFIDEELQKNGPYIIYDGEKLVLNTKENITNIPALTLCAKNNAGEYTKITIGEEPEIVINDLTGDARTSEAALKEALLTGRYVNGSNETVVSSFTLNKENYTIDADTIVTGKISFILNIKDDTFFRISQKSPNEVSTSITIDNIGYDKWQYDKQMPVIKCKTLTSNVVKLGDTLANVLESELPSYNAQNEFVAVSNVDGKDKFAGIYSYDASTKECKNITSKNKTRKIRVLGTIDLDTSVVGNIQPLKEGNELYNGGIFYVVSNTEIEKMTVGNTKGYELKPSIAFNTITLSCKEEVYPGQFINGGSWTGSLDPKGQDSYGSNIYWPNVLPEDSMTFIEVEAVNKFDDPAFGALDTDGFWTEVDNKIVDDVGPALDSYTFTIKGQRFCTHINEENIKEGKLGCAWRDEYYSIIDNAINECYSTEYDDAVVIMEPTGREDFKANLMALRVEHDTSTIISPKIITKAEFDQPSSIAVAGRITGRADYIGEFKVYDSYTGKYYWCMPIGDVGANLGRIMKEKLGGVAPAGPNDSKALGGGLARSVIEAKWHWKDSKLEELSKKGLNPITFEAGTGLQIRDHRTLQDPDNVTDWSYLGHSMSFDLCKREIRDQVMAPQLFKRINDYYFDIRQKQTDVILAKRLTGKDPIWTKAVCKIKDPAVNNETTKAQRNFVIRVDVWATPYSETVTLVFTTKAQV